VAITEAQRRELRGRAHRLKPCVHVGAGGVSAAVLRELETALDHHELVKVRVRARDRGERNAWIDALARETGAIGLSSIGNVAVLYRPRPATGDRVRRSPP
jgi:RNA-binding protein